MTMRFGRITRGRGKIYRLVHARPFDEGTTMEVSAFTSSGQRIPVKCVPVGESGTWLLIAPILEAPQKVRLALVSTDGTRIDGASCTIHPSLAALESKANTLFKNEDILSFRNYDAQALEGEWGFVIERMVPVSNGTEIVQGTARLSAATHDQLEGELSLNLQDLRGNLCAIGDCSILRDEREESRERPGWHERSVQFSFRISSALPAFIVSISGAGRESFLEYDAQDSSGMRDWWRHVATPASHNPGYMDWYKREHEASHAELAMQRSRSFEKPPTFSIVVPLYQTPISFFEEMVDSVLRQSYGHWELILVNASPENEELGCAAERRAELDERIRHVKLAENLGIALNTNAGIEAARGDYVCLLDHDDVLAPDALYCYATEIEEHPDCDLIYSDEDNLAGSSQQNPFFKPDWSPYFLLGMNYVCHFMCMSRTALGKVELPGSEYDGSQDHYLALAVGEIARCVRHVPRILYHWRIHPGSTSAGIDNKAYAVRAGERAVGAYFRRRGEDAEVEAIVDPPGTPAYYRVDYPVPADRPLVSVVIPNKDSVPVLERCLSSIRERTTYENYEVVVVENNSEDPATFDFYDRACSSDPRVRVVRFDGPFNYSAVCNLGAREARGDYLLMLNNDTEVITPEWMSRLVSLASRPDIGAVGAKLLLPDGTIQHAGVAMVRDRGPMHIGLSLDGAETGYFQMLRVPREVSVVTAACLMLRRRVFEELGGFDETFPVDYNDSDLCLKIRAAGYSILVDLETELYHYESLSRGRSSDVASQVRFACDQGEMRRRWPRYYACGDPFYSASFDSGYPYFSMR